MSGTPYLLDTNILVHFVRGSRVWQRIERRYSLLLRDLRPAYSIVTIGELLSLARRRGWAGRRLSQVGYIRAHLLSVSIDNDHLYDAYATIDTRTRQMGRPMSKNDLWIAATAHMTRTTILTTDHDFDHLAPAFIQLEWFDLTLPAGGTP